MIPQFRTIFSANVLIQFAILTGEANLVGIPNQFAHHSLDAAMREIFNLVSPVPQTRLSRNMQMKNTIE